MFSASVVRMERDCSIPESNGRQWSEIRVSPTLARDGRRFITTTPEVVTTRLTQLGPEMDRTGKAVKAGNAGGLTAIRTVFLSP